MQAELTTTIRDVSGKLHVIGSTVEVLRTKDNGLGKQLTLVRFEDSQTSYVFDEELRLK